MINAGRSPIRRREDGSIEYGPERFLRCEEEICCDECRVHICWAYDGDLNGSYFQCDSCRAKDVER